METKLLPSLSSKSPPSLQRKFGPAQIFLHAAPRSPLFLRAATGPSSSRSDNAGDTPPPPPPVMPAVTPPDTVEIRFRRGSRRRSKQLQQDRKNSSSGGGGGLPKTPSPPKDWESMTMAEKAVELYMGEKGLLFWLNKFAYASIFIIIGAWILFRFVGPSLGLYQLDPVPLSPKNSS
ncbi:uncharacterized protein LOC122658273 [Telopea speciosissima]|uniref:uncharacterized protein LOC122658273 n=1 Tax=Telopea speciosissima TaxID=54955 RepID=UPI001CC73FA9|nr:uncharacterized protein LOC122658273 [Telopea speciosissima]